MCFLVAWFLVRGEEVRVNRYRCCFGTELGGLLVFSLLVQVPFDCCGRFRKVLANVFGSEAWPCDKMAVLDGLDEGGGDGAEAGGMEELR